MSAAPDASPTAAADVGASRPAAARRVGRARERRAGRLSPVKRRLPAAAPAHRPFVRRVLAAGAGLAVAGGPPAARSTTP